MLKQFFILIFVAVLLASCGGNAGQQTDEATQEETVALVEGPEMIAIADFQEKAESLIGKEIWIQGNCVHVCKHGGKKMFLRDDEQDATVKITTDGEVVAAFQPDLEGSVIKVRGIVEAIETEPEIEEGEMHEEDEEHKNVYHKPQYSIAVAEYVVLEKAPADDDEDMDSDEDDDGDDDDGDDDSDNEDPEGE